jgi:hypothetical protein
LEQARQSVLFLTMLFLVHLANSSGSAESATTNSSGPIRLPQITIEGKRPSLHDVASESDLVGPANQPEWTARRAFAETDVYVIPPGQIEFNQFYMSSHSRHGKPENQFESEFEFGLPWRTQFDVEPNYRIENGRLSYDSTRLEIPHALADWGKIPLNPAIDAGWRFRNEESDSFLVRLLLTEEFCKRWHVGANLGYEQQVGGEREKEYELNLALSYVAIDQKVTIGAELLVEHETVEEEDEPSSTTVMLGPTLLFKPTRNTHLGLVPLFGITSDAPIAEVFFYFGIDLEPLTWWKTSESESDHFRPMRRSR